MCVCVCVWGNEGKKEAKRREEKNRRTEEKRRECVFQSDLGLLKVRPYIWQARPTVGV